MVLATSTSLTSSYQLCIEDSRETAPGRDGTRDPLVRADMVYVPKPNGGAVFSVGSMNWVGGAWPIEVTETTYPGSLRTSSNNSLGNGLAKHAKAEPRVRSDVAPWASGHK